MLYVTINRETWGRGKGAKGSALLREDGMQCCLGFACEAAGTQRDKLMGVPLPSQLPYWGGATPNPFERSLTRAVERAMALVNDNPNLDEWSRESILLHLAESVGMSFSFEGGVEPQPLELGAVWEDDNDA